MAPVLRHRCRTNSRRMARLDEKSQRVLKNSNLLAQRTLPRRINTCNSFSASISSACPASLVPTSPPPLIARSTSATPPVPIVTKRTFRALHPPNKRPAPTTASRYILFIHFAFKTAAFVRAPYYKRMQGAIATFPVSLLVKGPNFRHPRTPSAYRGPKSSHSLKPPRILLLALFGDQ